MEEIFGNKNCCSLLNCPLVGKLINLKEGMTLGLQNELRIDEQKAVRLEFVQYNKELGLGSDSC